MNQPNMTLSDQNMLSTIQDFLQKGDVRKAIDAYVRCLKENLNYQYILYALLNVDDRGVAMKVGLPIYNPHAPINQHYKYSLVFAQGWKDAKSTANGIANPFLKDLALRFILNKYESKTRSDIDRKRESGLEAISKQYAALGFFSKYDFNPLTEKNMSIFEKQIHKLVHNTQFDEAIKLASTLIINDKSFTPIDLYRIILNSLINRDLFLKSYQLIKMLKNDKSLKLSPYFFADFTSMWVLAYTDSRTSKSIDNGMEMAIELVSAISNDNMRQGIIYSTLQALNEACTTEEEKAQIQNIQENILPNGYRPLWIG